MATQKGTLLESALKRDRAVVLAGLVMISGLAWAYIVYLAQRAGNMGGTDISMPNLQPWTPVDFVTMLVMWTVMMAAMMVPTAAPMILVFARVTRTRREQARPYVPTGIFVLGYVVVWSGFAALATFVNWGLHSGGLLSSMMGGSTSNILGGVLLLAAGVFQWSPLKYACLTQCRSPLGFIMTEWREGAGGALRMGLRHGIYCLGCCWVLMTLLFVLGIMNLLWIAALAGFVLLEKVAPAGHWVSRVTGLVLIGWSVFMFTWVLS